MSIIKENSPIIETKRLILRKYKQEDAHDLFEIFGDETVNKYLPWFTYKSIKQVEDKINENIEYYKKDNGYRYVVVLKSENKVIGYINLSDNEGHDLGYGLNKKYWNKGYITEAASALVLKLKANGYDFITATHDRLNIPSGKVMINIGMKYMYSYTEQWMPKNIDVVFRMYQLNFKEGIKEYDWYKNHYKNSFIEEV